MIKLLKKFNKAEDGSVLVLVALSSLMLIGATGAAIDMARAQTLQQKISSSLDAAGLAAGQSASSTDPATQAQRYFTANFPAGYLGAGTVTIGTACADMLGTTVTCTSPSTYTISLTASTTQSTTFMKVLGIKTVNVAASSQITRQTSGMELSLVIDNTGSMSDPVNTSDSSVAKIDAVQCALAGAEITRTSQGRQTCSQEGLVTSGLIDILYGGNTNAPLSDLYIGIIPFSDMINVEVDSLPGSGMVNNVTPSNVNQMNGCVDSRSPTTASTNDTAINGYTIASGDTIHLDIGDDPPSTSYFQALTRSGNSQCPSATVQPISTTESNTISAIQSMRPSGSTLIPLGLAWGWRMLSPSWKDLWDMNSPPDSTQTFTYPNTNPPQTVSIPLPYNTTHMLKVMVFMTDGINNNGANNNSTYILTTNTGNRNTNNAYETQAYEPSDSALDQLSEDVCDAMKAKGIIIYTIGFGQTDPNAPPTINDRTGNNTYVDVPLLQYCATQNYTGDTSHFFLAPTNSQLEAAFQQIGDQLANLRVSH